MASALPHFVSRFQAIAAHLRDRGWRWPFTITGTQLRPIGMCGVKSADVTHQNDNDPDNTWRANAPR